MGYCRITRHLAFVSATAEGSMFVAKWSPGDLTVPFLTSRFSALCMTGVMEEKSINREKRKKKKKITHARFTGKD